RGKDRSRRGPAARLHPGAGRALAARSRVHERPVAASGARAASRGARVGADRGARQGRPRGCPGGTPRGRRASPQARPRRGGLLELRQGERPDLRRAHSVGAVKLDRVLQYSQAYNFYQWVFKRHAPEPGVVFLTQRRVYILPTRHGVSFGVALLLMLLG